MQIITLLSDTDFNKLNGMINFNNTREGATDIVVNVELTQHMWENPLLTE